ncbi:MAG: hypothetical protein K2Y21_08595 [Phycisphaerales bacterium]|nr:hypothetical protein [Phycisphaerales bacterium]
MRRGQTRRPNDSDPEALSKQQLLDAAGISSKIFDSIRKAARIKGPSHGGLEWMFSKPEVEALIRKADSGLFTERGKPAAEAWRALLRGEGLEEEASEDE